ncbi:MAG: lipid A biosynthesis protein, partial [Gammaproteobacteria bacterium]
GPGEIARVTGFPVFFMKLVRPKRGHYEIIFVELASSKAGLPTEDITRKYAATMEQLVIDRPADWFWIHRRWKLKKPLYDE